jgi:hypothetical protein
LLVGVEIRRVVTGRDSREVSCFTSVETVEPISVGGMQVVNLWGTGDEGAHIGNDPAEKPELFPFFPDGSGHGTRLLAVHFAPDSWEATDAEASMAQLEAAAEMERLQPGLSQVFEPDSPGMHTTDTVDYGICIRGELWLELDDGAEERITPGTVVVQRGTRHAWRNRSDEVATMIYVLIGAQRD